MMLDTTISHIADTPSGYKKATADRHISARPALWSRRLLAQGLEPAV